MGLKRLKNLNSTRTKYNASDVVLPSWRFLKDVNFGVKLEQERLNLDKGLCSMLLKLCLPGLCVYAYMLAN